MVLPFLLLSYFNHPSADDFGLAENTRLHGFFVAQKYYYNSWTGKYFSNAVLSVNPLYFKSISGYKAVTFLLMILFFYILFLLITELTKDKLNFKERILFTLSIFFLYLYSMPSVSQSFFWMTAAIVYQLGIMMIMIFLILYLRLININDRPIKYFYIMLSSIILIAAVGCSEMAMTLCVIVITVLNVRYLIDEKKISKLLLFYAILTAAASYIVVSAPGNKIREQLFPDNHQFFYSLSLSFSILARCFFSWIINSPIILVSLLIMPVIFKLVNKNEKNSESIGRNVYLSVIMFLIFILALIFIPVWSIGKEPYSRTLNVIYFVFLAGWFYNIIVTVSYMVKKYDFSLNKFPRYIYLAAFIGLLIFLVKKNNVRVAYADLLRGTAYHYNNEIYDRYDYIIHSASDSCEVTEIRDIPRTIFVSDISSNANEELNQKYALYFNKKSIILKVKDRKP